MAKQSRHRPAGRMREPTRTDINVWATLLGAQLSAPVRGFLSTQSGGAGRHLHRRAGALHGPGALGSEGLMTRSLFVVGPAPSTCRCPTSRSTCSTRHLTTVERRVLRVRRTTMMGSSYWRGSDSTSTPGSPRCAARRPGHGAVPQSDADPPGVYGTAGRQPKLAARGRARGNPRESPSPRCPAQAGGVRSTGPCLERCSIVTTGAEDGHDVVA
jgi:hypothetical protein